MPLYEYECRTCEARFDQLTSMSEADAIACPRCGAAEARRLISVIGGMTGVAQAPPAQCGAGACGNC